MIPHTTYELAMDGSHLNCSLTDSWAIKLGNTILKTGGKIPNGSSKPNSNRAERGAYMDLLINLSILAKEFNISHFTLIIYIDNTQVIDHSGFPQQGTGPNAFHLEDHDLLEVIN